MKKNRSVEEGKGMEILLYKDIEANLANIFPEAIILNTQFEILNLSDSVLELLGYKRENLIGRNLSEIVYEDFAEIFEILHKGYFVHSQIRLIDSYKNILQLHFSGYFLGLISDMNGKVILLIKNLKESIKERKREERRFRIINQIIYRSSHDIRGPLCTIKGLIQLALMEECSPSMAVYLDKVSKSVERLDLKLSYIRESINKENLQCIYSPLSEIIDRFIEQLEKFSEMYGLKVEVRLNNYNPHKPFFTSQQFINFFIQNLLLVLESVNESSHFEYLIEIHCQEDNLLFVIRNHNISRRMNKYFGDLLGFRNMKRLLNSDGYNYLNLRILKVCQEVIKATVNADAIDPSVIKVEIPSLPFNFKK